MLVVGQDPYPTPGHPIGLSFAVDAQRAAAARGAWSNIYQELRTDVGIVPPRTATSPAGRPGVMLLNRVLTVRPGASASHRGRGWEEVTECAIQALVRRVGAGGPPAAAILWGRDAQ